MEKHKYLDDLKEIRQIMRKSTQFLSLSGLSGVLAGIYALIGAGLAFSILEDHYSEQSFLTVVYACEKLFTLITSR